MRPITPMKKAKRTKPALIQTIDWTRLPVEDTPGFRAIEMLQRELAKAARAP
jgi:hypothetical protein